MAEQGLLDGGWVQRGRAIYAAAEIQRPVVRGQRDCALKGLAGVADIRQSDHRVFPFTKSGDAPQRSRNS